MRKLIERIGQDGDLARAIVFRRLIPGREARFRDLARPLPDPIRRALDREGISRLYRHQAEAIDAVRDGRHVMAVTPTASGKSLIFFLPTLERALSHPGRRALYIYPYKALEQDQLQAFRRLAEGVRPEDPVRAEIYDGDTSQSDRKRIRGRPPDVLITNPDMLHMGILAYHPGWRDFFRNLDHVVIDELHVYRGIFGAHFHHIIQRLHRICRHYGSDPRFIVCSATVAHPERLGETIIGKEFQVVRGNGAPRAPRHFLFLNPAGSPYMAATKVLAGAVEAGFRTLAFTKARKITELIHSWFLRNHPGMASRISAYRAGYLPEERREIERRLLGGDLMGVIATSALELGIDIGGLDVCILVGYPGSMMSSWQRIGRVGRQERESLVVMVALPDALDQFFMANPEEFFDREFEEVVLDPENRTIASSHLVCAGAELPITERDRSLYSEKIFGLIPELTREGRLLAGEDGDRWYSLRRNPQRGVSIRSLGEGYSIHDMERDGKVIGSVDGVRAFHECHPGAVYLHHGQQYEIRRLDIDRRRVEAAPANLDYYTEVLAEKETEILEQFESIDLEGYSVKLGRLKVTEQIREYCKRRIFGQDRLGYFLLDLPPVLFETVGLWLELPGELREAVEDKQLNFMGGIHAVEHAAISLFPLFAICDRSDIGGISYPRHPQIGRPAIFIYDGYPGGIGLSARGFRDIGALLERTEKLIAACPCDTGCPSCIHSPKCGNGNRPLDKEAARRILAFLNGRWRITLRPASPRHQAQPPQPGPLLPAVQPAVEPRGRLFFDLETRLSAEEVGGWGRADKMRLALAVIYDEERGVFETFAEPEVDRLLETLLAAELVVGFNVKRFDYAVLGAYTKKDLGGVRTLDMLEEIHRKVGFRISLNRLAGATLGEEKSADGLQSLRWFREGRVDLVEQYCRKDVEITRKLFEYGRDNGHLLFREAAGNKVRIPVDW